MKTNYLNQSTSTGNGLYGSFVNNSKVSATDGLPLRYRCADDNKELLSLRYPFGKRRKEPNFFLQNLRKTMD